MKLFLSILVALVLSLGLALPVQATPAQRAKAMRQRLSERVEQRAARLEKRKDRLQQLRDRVKQRHLLKGEIVTGSGTITANGEGVIRIFGNGTVKVSGAGVLTVRDIAGDAKIEVSGKGRKKKLPSGATRYAGFGGTATITGTDIRVRIRGARLGFSATGTGRVFLYGKGTWRSGDKSGSWRPRIVFSLAA